MVFTLWTGMVAFTLVMYPWNRRRHEQLIREGFERLDSPWIRYRLGDEGLTIESRTTLRKVAWADVRRAFVGRTFWILYARGHGRLLLPVSALPPGAERYLLDHLTQAGCRVRLEKDHPLQRYA